MKNLFKSNKNFINLVALLLISYSHMVSNSASFILWGEPTPPKSLLK